MLAVFKTIDLVLNLYIYILIAMIIFSWLYAFNVINARNQVVALIGDFLHKATEPVLAPIRRFMPDLGGIDISPIVVFVAIYFIRVLMWTSVAPLFGVY